MHPLTAVYRNCLFKMRKPMNRNEADFPRSCGLYCLGPLAFHTEAVGHRITLSHGARRAERASDTFRNGVVFSSRPVRVMERVRLRVDHTARQWHGALRLGFTAIKPGRGPQAEMTIPNLTHEPGYWAAPVPEVCALPGSELQFWVSSKGRLMYKGQGGQKNCLLEGLDISKPLWAMIDVYGQTCTVALLGSKKRCLFGTRKSCHALAPPPAYPRDCCLCVTERGPCSCLKSPPSSELFEISCNRCPSITDNQWTEDFKTVESCVVCLSQVACVILCCGHQCLCMPCAKRVMADFGTCPLCRQPITSQTS